MTAHRLVVYLSDDERGALQAYARRERRDPRAQAALLIHDSLQREGLLPIDQAQPIKAQAAGVQHDIRS